MEDRCRWFVPASCEPTIVDFEQERNLARVNTDFPIRVSHPGTGFAEGRFRGAFPNREIAADMGGSHPYHGIHGRAATETLPPFVEMHCRLRHPRIGRSDQPERGFHASKSRLSRRWLKASLDKMLLFTAPSMDQDTVPLQVYKETTKQFTIMNRSRTCSRPPSPGQLAGGQPMWRRSQAGRNRRIWLIRQKRAQGGLVGAQPTWTWGSTGCLLRCGARQETEPEFRANGSRSASSLKDEMASGKRMDAPVGRRCCSSIDTCVCGPRLLQRPGIPLPCLRKRAPTVGSTFNPNRSLDRRFCDSTSLARLHRMNLCFSFLTIGLSSWQMAESVFHPCFIRGSEFMQWNSRAPPASDRPGGLHGLA